MAHLDIHLLGPLQVLLDGSPVGFESAKVRALLAVLAGEAPRPQFRESLAGLIWSDWPQQSAMSNLRYALADLRKNTGDRDAHPPFFLINRELIQLDLESDVTVDAVEFFKSGDVDLYRGPFLEGFSLSDSPAFTEWLEAKRSYYQQQMLDLLGKRAAACEQSGEYEQGLAYARRQLSIEPWLEEAHRQVMRLLALSGKRSAALVQYEAGKRVLEKELNATPEEETCGLYERIRKGEWPSSKTPVEPARPIHDSGPKHNMPVQLTSFIGREKEISEIHALLTEQFTSGLLTGRLVTLTGSGGCGKTRLMLEIAGKLVDVFPDGVWLVELALLSDAGIIPTAIASALGLQPQGDLAVVDVLNNYLKRRRLLLVIDNCEHVLDACARLVEQLLRACPGLVILASSREILGVSGEASYRVPTLSIPDPEQSGEIDLVIQSEAVRLFADRAGLARPGFRVSSQNAPAIVHICRRLDGIPLAIELAAARVAMLSVEQIDGRLSDLFHLLTSRDRAGLPRQQTLRASIDWSYSLLSEKERLLLQRLSVFAGGWTLEAAERVCSFDRIEPGEVLDLLTGLAEKSLVIFQGETTAGQFVEPQAEPRYRLLETIREYAHETLAAGNGRGDVSRMHLAYYTDLLEAAEKESNTPRQSYWIYLLALELENIRMALQWGLVDTNAGSFQSGLRLIATIGLIDINIHAQEAHEWLEKYLSQQDMLLNVSQEVLAKALQAKGRILMKQKFDCEVITQSYLKSFRLYQELGDVQRQVEILSNMVFIQSFCRGQQDAWEYLDRGFSVAQQAGILQENWGLLQWAKATCNALSANKKGEWGLARQCYIESVEAYEKKGDRMGSLLSLTWLGSIVSNQGDTELAAKYLQKAVSTSREMNSLSNLQWALTFSGDNAYRQNRFDQMAAYFSEAQQVCEKTGFQLGYQWSVHHTGVASKRSGHLKRAIQLVCHSLDLAEENGWEVSQFEAIASLAGLAAELDRCEESARLFGFLSTVRDQMVNLYLVVPEMEIDLPVVRAALGDDAFEAAFAEGKSLTLEAAAELGREAVKS